MANAFTSTRTSEHHITIRRQAQEAMVATLAMQEMLRALAEAIEVLPESSYAYEACTSAFCRYARGRVL